MCPITRSSCLLRDANQGCQQFFGTQVMAVSETPQRSCFWLLQGHCLTNVCVGGVIILSLSLSLSLSLPLPPLQAHFSFYRSRAYRSMRVLGWSVSLMTS